MRIVWMAIALLLASGGVALADIYYLKDGGRIEGQGTERGENILIRVPLGSITVPKSKIARVVKKKSILDIYEDRLKNTKKTADDWYALAMWCEAAGLSRQAHEHLREVLGLDSEHAAARRRLGYVKVGHRWMTEDERHEWKGEIKFRGRWMPPETVAAILEAEALQQKLAKMAIQRAAGKKGGPKNRTPVGQPKKVQPPIKPNPPKQNNNQNKNNQNNNQPILLSRSIRPSKGFLDKYFITNPWHYGNSGARVHYGPYRTPTGRVGYRPVQYGPYPYDGYSGRTPAVPTGGYGPAPIGIYVNGGYAGIGTYTSGGFGSSFGGFGGGGLNLGYTFGKPGDDFFLRGNVGAGRTSGFGGFHEWVGHSFFGTFRAGSSRFTFGFN